MTPIEQKVHDALVAAKTGLTSSEAAKVLKLSQRATRRALAAVYLNTKGVTRVAEYTVAKGGRVAFSYRYHAKPTRTARKAP